MNLMQEKDTSIGYRKHTDSTVAGADGSTDSNFGTARTALSRSITSLGGGKGLLR